MVKKKLLFHYKLKKALNSSTEYLKYLAIKSKYDEENIQKNFKYENAIQKMKILQILV